MDQPTLERLNELGDRLEALQKPLRISEYTAPVNRLEERDKLFAAHARGISYNPRFLYREAPSEWDASLRNFLSELRTKTNDWEALLYNDAEHTLSTLKDAQTHDPDSITLNTTKLYGEPTEFLVQRAREELVQHREDTESRNIATQAAADILCEALRQIGLAEWEVIIDPVMSARMSVRGVDKKVYVRKGEYFTDSETKRLLVHEIGTHVFRSVNGERHPLRLLRLGLTNYVLTEEGMATYHEYRHGVRSVADLRRYALRVIAAYQSLSCDFYTVFCEIAQHTTLEEAFGIVTRSKRGFRDTSVPGAHVKDKVYLEGFYKIVDYLEKHEDDYLLLMSGKVSIEMLPKLKVLKQAGLLAQPAFLPEMLISWD